DSDRPVRPENNIAAEDILAVSVPHMWMERIVNNDIVLGGAEEALAMLNAAVQRQVVVKVVIRRSVVQVDIPPMVASPAIVAQDVRFHHVGERQVAIPSS